MHTIHKEKDLEEAIRYLETKLKSDGSKLKLEIQGVIENIKPVTILKNVIQEALHSSDVKESIVQKSVGYSLGFAVKKLYESISSGPFTKILGTGIMFGVSDIVNKNPETVNFIGSKLLGLFKGKSKLEKV